MTEYDYSPQAWERYMATQERIVRWVDNTRTQQPCNAFSPATPHVQVLKLKEEEEKKKKQRRREERRGYYDDASDVSDDQDSRYARSSQKTTRHRKSHSTKEATSHRSPRKERSRERERERERDRDRERRDRARDQERASTRTYKPEKTEKYGRYDSDYVWVDRDAHTSSSSPSRPRSSSQSVASKPRTSYNSRSHTIPHLSLDVPPMPLQPQEQYYYHDHRNSHSSQSSATTPNSGSTTHGTFPIGQVPHSAPPITGQAPRLGSNPPKPLRAQTMPFAYGAGYPQADKNGYPRPPVGSQPVAVPIRPTVSGSKSYGAPMAYAPDPSKAPQLPYSAYQSPSKPQSLLKRVFGFKVKHEPIPQPQYHPSPRPTRGDKDSAMFLGGGGSGRREGGHLRASGM